MNSDDPNHQTARFCGCLHEPRNTTPTTPLPPPEGPSPIVAGSPVMQIRHYRADDFREISPWWAGHGEEPWPEALVTSVGCVVQRRGELIAAGWLFLVENSFVAFFHGLVTRPGLSRKDAREAIAALVDGLEIIMRASGRTLMLGTVPPGAMLRSARSLGFAPIGEPIQQVVKVIKP